MFYNSVTFQTGFVVCISYIYTQYLLRSMEVLCSVSLKRACYPRLDTGEGRGGVGVVKLMLASISNILNILYD